MEKESRIVKDIFKKLFNYKTYEAAVIRPVNSVKRIDM